MAGTPEITLTPRVVHSGDYVNVTALTGGVQGDQSLAGYSEADWGFLNDGFHREKHGGGQQLWPTLFGGCTQGGLWNGAPLGGSSVSGDADLSPLAGGPGYPEYAGTGDSVTVYSMGGAIQYQCTGINKGIAFNPMSSKRRRTMSGIGILYEGTYEVRASLSDGSAASQAITFTANSSGTFFGFDCRHRSLANGGTLELKITRIVDNGQRGDIYIPVVWTGVPEPELRGRGAKIYYEWLANQNA